MLRKVIKQWLTESDNETHDVCRVLAVLAVLTAIVLAAYAVVANDQPFSMQDYGIGVGALFAGLGVALGMKKETEKGE